jgi:hypothetical protein
LNRLEISDKFVPLEQLNPEAARQLLPGVRLHLSRRTFAQVAAEKFNAIGHGIAAGAASSLPGVTVEQASVVRAMALAARVPPGNE